MNTYIFVQKNSSHTMILDADNEEEARDELADEVKDITGWRLDSVQDEDGNDMDDIPDDFEEVGGEG